MSYCVYWLRTKSHTDIFSQGYVGITRVDRFERRMWEHQVLCKNAHLKNAIAKYGWEDMDKSILLYGDKDYCAAIENNLRMSENTGWNIAAGGGLPASTKGRTFKWSKPSPYKGVLWSSERKKKHSEIMLSVMDNEETREKLRLSHLGKPSPRKGTTVSPESIAKMRASKLGNTFKRGTKVSPQSLENMRKAIHDAAWECPHCKTTGLGRGAGNRWHFNNCKTKGVENVPRN